MHRRRQTPATYPNSHISFLVLACSTKTSCWQNCFQIIRGSPCSASSAELLRNTLPTTLSSILTACIKLNKGSQYPPRIFVQFYHVADCFLFLFYMILPEISTFFRTFYTFVKFARLLFICIKKQTPTLATRSESACIEASAAVQAYWLYSAYTRIATNFVEQCRILKTFRFSGEIRQKRTQIC